jgi:hypothetical protein
MQVSEYGLHPLDRDERLIAVHDLQEHPVESKLCDRSRELFEQFVLAGLCLSIAVEVLVEVQALVNLRNLSQDVLYAEGQLVNLLGNTPDLFFPRTDGRMVVGLPSFQLFVVLH